MTTLRKLLLTACMLMATAFQAWGLDVRDIVALLQHGVHEEVIVNMVRGNGLPAPLTTEDVLVLNSTGASPLLMEFLTSPEAVNPLFASPGYLEPPAIVDSPLYYDTSPYLYSDPLHYDNYDLNYSYGYGYDYGYTYPWYSGSGYYGNRYNGNRRRGYSRPPPPPPSRPHSPPGRPGGGGGGNHRPGHSVRPPKPGGDRPPKPPEGGERPPPPRPRRR